MKKRRPVVLVALAAVLLGACSGGGSKTSTSGSSGTTAPAQRQGNPDAVLRIASTIGDRTYDPIKPPTCAGEFWTLQLVYARLTNLTPDFKVEPMLADGWKFASDGSTLTLNLHKGVAFRDGTPFNAAAVKANIDRAMTDPKSTQKTEFQSVKSVAAADDSTVVISLKPGQGYELPEKLAGCAGMMVNPSSFAKTDLDQSGDGLGPYVVKPGTFKAGQAATLVRAPGAWWGDPAIGPHFSEIQTTPIQDPVARLNALQSGQVDIVDITPDQFSRAQQLASSGGFQVQKYDSHLSVSVSINMTSPVMQNLALRQAVNLAIDRQGIANAVFSGGCTATVQTAAKGTIGYDPNLEGQWAYNPTKAKQLLSQAGLSNVAIHGLQHTTQPYAAANDAMVAQLKAVGISYNLDPPLVSTQVLPKWASGAADMFGFPFGAALSPLGALVDDASGPYVVKHVTSDAVKAAATGLSDPTISDQQRSDKALATNQALTNDATFLPICRVQRMIAANSKLIGIDKSSEVQFGTIDVEYMQMTS